MLEDPVGTADALCSSEGVGSTDPLLALVEPVGRMRYARRTPCDVTPRRPQSSSEGSASSARP